MALQTKPLNEIVTFTRDSGATRVNAAGLIVGVDFSSTSNTIGTGSRTFVLAADMNVNRDWPVDSRVRVVSQAGAVGTMTGTVVSYTPSTQTLVINVVTITGLGTSTNWRIGSLEFRIDHDPVTLSPRGGLVEGGATNLAVPSEFISGNNGGFSILGSATISDSLSEVSPTGRSGSYLITTTAPNGRAQENFSIPSGGMFFSGVFIFKRPGFARFSVLFNGIPGTGTEVTFNTDSGTVLRAVGQHSIVSIGNTWFITGSAVVPAFGSGVVQIFPGNSVDGSGNLISATGDTTKFVGLIAQINHPVGSYIPTTTAQVSRAADLPNVDGERYTQFYNQTGTLYLETIPTTGAVGAVAASFNDGTLANAIRVQQKQSGTRSSIRAMATDGVTDFLGLDSSVQNSMRSNGVDYLPELNGTGPIVGNVASSGAGQFIFSNANRSFIKSGLSAAIERLRTISQMQAEAPILDTFDGAVAAYSLRRIRTAYNGPAIRVRRSNDNAEQDIGFIGGNLDTSALLAFTAANSGFVTTWYDQSGNGRNAVQPMAINQPRVVNAGVVEVVNGRPTVLYTADTSLTTSESFPILGNFSYFTVEAIPEALSETRTFFSVYHGNAGANGHGFIQRARREFLFGGRAIVDVGASIIGAATIRSAHRSGNVGLNSIFSNSVLAANDGAVPSLGSGTLDLGRATGPAQAQISEAIYYTGDQSYNRAIIESNMAAYFSVTVPSIVYPVDVSLRAIHASFGNNISVYLGEGASGFSLGAQTFSANTFSPTNVNCLEFLGGFFYAGRTAGVQRSADGRSWTSHAIGGVSFEVRDLAFSGTLHIAVGSGGRYSTSADGVTWAESALTGVTTQQLNAANFANGVFVIVGNGGVILTTVDGATYALRTSVTTANLFSVMFSQRDQRWYAAGDNGTILSAIDPTGTWENISNDAAAAVINGGIVQANPLLPNFIPSQVNKVAMRLASNNVATSVNGADAVVDTSVSIPASNRLSIAMNGVNGQQFNGHIRRIRYFTDAMTDAQLKEMTQ